jgi:hypothetical protein
MEDLGLLDHPLDFRQEVRSLNPLDARRPSPGLLYPVSTSLYITVSPKHDIC